MSHTGSDTRPEILSHLSWLLPILSGVGGVASCDVADPKATDFLGTLDVCTPEDGPTTTAWATLVRVPVCDDEAELFENGEMLAHLAYNGARRNGELSDAEGALG